ncbi:MAG: hypothetical protein LUQ69_01790 [Methanoregulaceae archaeon]|nr:hypothetical protein [Methanoregulaceae archaeon]
MDWSVSDPDAVPGDPVEPVTEESVDGSAGDPREPPEDPGDIPLSDPADRSSADPVAVFAAPVSPPFEEAGPDGPECAASAGRHAIHIPSARIRRI